MNLEGDRIHICVDIWNGFFNPDFLGDRYEMVPRCTFDAGSLRNHDPKNYSKRQRKYESRARHSNRIHISVDKFYYIK